MIHVGRRKTLRTLCGKPVARRWWVEAPHWEGGVGPGGLLVRRWVNANRSASCPECLVKEKKTEPLPLESEPEAPRGAIPMILHCPMCRERHIDEGDFATKLHHTHACQSCGVVWRPAILPTVGVKFLPGFKDGE